MRAGQARQVHALGNDYKRVVDTRLHLTLEPILPRRAPRRDCQRSFDYGYDLRIPNGPLVARDDPLLEAVGAEVVTVHTTKEFEQAFQEESIAPGRNLKPTCEPPDDDGDAVVSLWDEQGTRCVGLLPWQASARVAAAIEHGVGVELKALSETRTATDDRRVALEVLISVPSTLTVLHDPEVAFSRPARPSRRRVVLFADDTGDVRWWDAAGESGPAEVSELPVSRELRRELKKLRRAYARLGGDAGDSPDTYELMDAGWQRRVLAREGIRLWRRARQELGRGYHVGYLGPGMQSPAWSPTELSGEDDEDELIPF